jgi:hypothetical protein
LKKFENLKSVNTKRRKAQNVKLEELLEILAWQLNAKNGTATDEATEGTAKMSSSHWTLQLYYYSI